MNKWWIIIFWLLPLTLVSQTIEDAYRYSFTKYGGTARGVATGGAFGSLGGEFLSISINPAGMGVYRSSELSLTPSLFLNGVESDFSNNSFSNTSSRVHFNNLGVVFAMPADDEFSKWRSVNIGIGYNRLANFKKEYEFEGKSPNSISHRFTEFAIGFDPQNLNPFYEGLAEQTGLITQNFQDPTQYDFYPELDQPVQKKQSFNSSGEMDELLFGMAGNYKDKLYIGATVGFILSEYREQKVYEETDPDDEIPVFNNMLFEERFRTDGTGVNLKVGAIYRINRMFRTGLSLHTPTSYGMTDNFQNLLDTNTELQGTVGAETEESVFEYSLRTPWKANWSFTTIIPKRGFVSLDVEFLDYTFSQFTFDTETTPELEGYQTELNTSIENTFKNTLNIRLGAEYALKDFRIRGGYALYGNPYLEGGASNHNYSFGLGWRHKRIFIDAGYVLSRQSEEYYPFTLVSRPESDWPLVINTQTIQNFLITLGYRFGQR